MFHAPNSQREPGKLSGSIAIHKKELRRNVQFTDVIENLLLFISRSYPEELEEMRSMYWRKKSGPGDGLSSDNLSVSSGCLLSG